MAQKYIPLFITKADRSPQGITSSLTAGNNYGEATGIGEQVYRYEALTGTSTFTLDTVDSGDAIDLILKFRVPQSDDGTLQIDIADSSNNGYRFWIMGGRVLFGSYIAAGTQTDSTVTILSTISDIQNGAYLRLTHDGTAATGVGWAFSETEPTSNPTSINSTSFNDNVSRTIKLSIVAPSTADAIPALYDLHWAGIGTAGDVPPTFPIGGQKNVTGTVRAPDGTPVSQPYPVRLCHRATGTVLARGMTDTNGRYSLTANVPASELCYVLSVDTRNEQWVSAITGNV